MQVGYGEDTLSKSMHSDYQNLHLSKKKREIEPFRVENEKCNDQSVETEMKDSQADPNFSPSVSPRIIGPRPLTTGNAGRKPRKNNEPQEVLNHSYYKTHLNSIKRMVDIEYAGELSGSYVCLNREFREQL